MIKVRIQISFDECEHPGDLDNYIQEVRDSGAIILSSMINYEAETGLVDVEIPDFERFLTEFEKTNAIEFATLITKFLHNEKTHSTKGADPV
jgi:hypothetical protein